MHKYKVDCRSRMSIYLRICHRSHVSPLWKICQPPAHSNSSLYSMPKRMLKGLNMSLNVVLSDRYFSENMNSFCKPPEFGFTTLWGSIATFSPYTGFRLTLCAFFRLFHRQKTAGAIFSRPSAMSLLEHVCLKVLTVLNKSRHAFTGTLQGCVLS